jgi:hypothetical protein
VTRGVLPPEEKRLVGRIRAKLFALDMAVCPSVEVVPAVLAVAVAEAEVPAPNNGPMGTPKTSSQCSIYQDGSATGAGLYTLCSKVFPNGPVSNQIRGCLRSVYIPGSGYINPPNLVPGIPGVNAHLTCWAEAAGLLP